jgi:hypothetical protein
MALEHCPAEVMLADHFAKPLQGSMFRQFRDEIQGIPVNTPASSLSWDQDQVSTNNGYTNLSGPSSEECVGTFIIRICVGNDTTGSTVSGLTANPAKIRSVSWRKPIEGRAMLLW